MAGAKVYDKFQFERNGFFSVDPDSSAEKVCVYDNQLLAQIIHNSNIVNIEKVSLNILFTSLQTSLCSPNRTNETIQETGLSFHSRI